MGFKEETKKCVFIRTFLGDALLVNTSLSIWVGRLLLMKTIQHFSKSVLVLACSRGYFCFVSQGDCSGASTGALYSSWLIGTVAYFFINVIIFFANRASSSWLGRVFFIQFSKQHSTSKCQAAQRICREQDLLVKAASCL